MFDIYEASAINKSEHKTYRIIRQRKIKLIADGKRGGKVNVEIRHYFWINNYLFRY